MQSVNFQRLKARLLQGGVAPKYVRRTLLELGNHVDELTAQERANGATETDARQTALEKLGDEDSLVREALSKKEIQSLSRTYTKSVFLLVPTLAYLLAAFSLLFLGIGPISELAANADGRVATLQPLAKAFTYFIEYLITPLFAACFAILAIKRNVGMLWPMTGIFILCFFGSGFETQVQLPIINPRADGIKLIWGYSFLPWESARPPWPQTLEQLVRIAASMGLATLLFKRYRPEWMRLTGTP